MYQEYKDKLVQSFRLHEHFLRPSIFALASFFLRIYWQQLRLRNGSSLRSHLALDDPSLHGVGQGFVYRSLSLGVKGPEFC